LNLPDGDFFGGGVQMHETPARNERIPGHSEPILNSFGAGSATDPRCRIELFGGLRLLQGDRVITRFRTHKAATLLAYLALHLRAVPGDP
jgi:hypothetical protein